MMSQKKIRDQEVTSIQAKCKAWVVADPQEWAVWEECQVWEAWVVPVVLVAWTWQA
jgi:hypothetical protein